MSQAVIRDTQLVEIIAEEDVDTSAEPTLLPTRALSPPRVEELSRALQSRAALSDSDGSAVIEVVRDLLRTLPAALIEGEAVTRISLLEDVKSAVVAAQARETVAFAELRREREASEGVPASQQGKGLGSEIALARREAPNAGSRFLAMARTLTEDMPHAMAALTAGKLSEFATTMLVKEVIALPRPARTTVDTHLAERYGTLGVRALSGQARALANQADPHAPMLRHELARSERCVTIRPAPDAMAYLTAYIPVTQAFACKKALIDAATTSRVQPDPTIASDPGAVTELRSSAQTQADILVERLTGQSRPDAIPVQLHVVMSDSTVFGVSREQLQREGEGGRDSLPVVDEDGRTADPTHAAAWSPGIGPLPAIMARDLLSPIHDGPGSGERVFLRRVLVDPITGDINAIDSRARAFTGTLRRALVLRDDRCRTPWCGAPIIHLDHTHPYAHGGATNASNGTGLCARCNYTKENVGWRHERVPNTGELAVTTPTGHRYTAEAPPLLPRLSVQPSLTKQRSGDPPVGGCGEEVITVPRE